MAYGHTGRISSPRWAEDAAREACRGAGAGAGVGVGVGAGEAAC